MKSLLIRRISEDLHEKHDRPRTLCSLTEHVAVDHLEGMCRRGVTGLLSFDEERLHLVTHELAGSKGSHCKVHVLELNSAVPLRE